MDKKSPIKATATELIADVFDGRQSTASERKWAKEVLGPVLAQNPERPIGNSIGVNIDAQGNARYTTISGVPIRRLYTQATINSPASVLWAMYLVVAEKQGADWTT